MNLSKEQKTAIIMQLLGEADPNEVVVKGKGYINKDAAKLLKFCQRAKPDLVETYGQVFTKEGIPFEKAYKDYYGESIEKAASDYTGMDSEFASVTDFRGTGFLAEQTAQNFWSFVYRVADPFMKRIGFITSKKNPMPINLITSVEENLISSVRSQDGQPGINLKKQVAIFRKNLLARHIEMQFDVQYEDVVNNLDNPNFLNEILEPVMVGYANDILRLWTNGTSYDYHNVTLSTSYSRDDMYRLLTGWVYKLQNGNGSFMADNVSIVLGSQGKHMTANKLNIDATGTVAKWSPSLSDVDEFTTAGSDATLSVSSNKLKVMKDTNDSSLAYGRKDGIEVIPNKNATLNITYNNATGATSHIVIKDNAGNVLKETPTLALTSDTNLSIKFYTRNAKFVNVEFYADVYKGAGSTIFTEFSNIALTQDVASYGGFKIQEIMDKMIKMRRLEYRSLKGYCFIMGAEDIAEYAESKGSPIQITPSGQYVSSNNTVREQWRVSGEIPMHRGHEVVLNPFMHSISEAKTYGGVSIYGSIIFGIPTDLKGFGLEGNFPMQPLSIKEFKARGKHGGAEIEYTKHAWTDAEVVANGKFGIAFQGAKCEVPVVMDSDEPKANVQSTTVTSGSTIYPYCDTIGARTFACVDTNGYVELESLEDAIAGVSAGTCFEVVEGAGTTLADGTYKFRSFKEDYLLPSELTNAYTVS